MVQKIDQKGEGPMWTAPCCIRFLHTAGISSMRSSMFHARTFSVQQRIAAPFHLRR